MEDTPVPPPRKAAPEPPGNVAQAAITEEELGRQALFESADLSVVRPLLQDCPIRKLAPNIGNVIARGRCCAPVEDAFRAMVAVAMTIESYRTQRTARWDAERETITS